jgi:hypothetical protein
VLAVGFSGDAREKNASNLLQKFAVAIVNRRLGGLNMI